MKVSAWLPWCLCGLLLAGASRGVFPVTPVEGDEQGVIFGVAGMITQDPELLQRRYLYELQPGYYHLLAGLSRASAIHPENVFAITTVLGGLGFAIAGALLLQKVLAWPAGWTLFAMLWCQETATAAFYLNTSSLAGAVAVASLLPVLRSELRGRVVCGVGLAIAGWLRADSLLVAPACLGLAYLRSNSLRQAFIHTTQVATVSCAGVVLLYALSGTPLFAATQSYTDRPYLLSSVRTLLESPLLIISPLGAVTSVVGIALIIIRRHRAYALIVGGGILPSVLAYGMSLTTPKYFYYAVPFALIPALYALQGTASKRWAKSRWGIPLLATALLVDGAVGVRTLRPEQRYFTTSPSVGPLWSRMLGDRPLAAVIGPGELIYNADGFRLRTGHLFAPSCWHREKVRIKEDMTLLREWLESGRSLTLYWPNWLAQQIALRELYAAGFRPVKDTGPAETWLREDQRVRLAYLGYVGSLYQPQGPAPASDTGRNTLFIGDKAKVPMVELVDQLSWHRLSATPEGFLVLYQRR